MHKIVAVAISLSLLRHYFLEKQRGKQCGKANFKKILWLRKHLTGMNVKRQSGLKAKCMKMAMRMERESVFQNAQCHLQRKAVALLV